MESAEPVLQAIMSRRSVRRYTGQPVTREQLETLLDAAMAAPSANNVRPWHFVVVQDAATRQALSRVHRWAHMIADAAAAIAVCAESESNPFWIDDCSAATENILIAAQAMGLGAVWIGIHQESQHQRRVREALGIPESFAIHCLIAIGYPAEHHRPHGKHDPAKAHWERF